MSKPLYKFPKDFLWGASTSSHQVEGGTYNQWTVWELENAAHQAKTAEDRLGWLPNWKDIASQATDPSNYVSGEAVDHYNRYKEDFDMAKGLGLNAFRFSIEWSRIEPEEGKWDEAAIEHYRTYIQELKKRGLEPFLNLWHMTNPVWFEDKGGFMERKNIVYFLRFAATIMEELGSELNYVLILNEPNIYAWFSYKTGEWPAPKHSTLAFARAYLNLVSVHRQTYKILKASNPKIQFSSAPQLVINEPKDPKNLIHQLGAWSANIGNNWLWLWATHSCNDFIAYNNYFKNYMSGLGTKGIDNPKTPLNDMGWYMEPDSAAEMAMALQKRFPDMPIYITESGVADAKDARRQWWIEENMKALSQAIEQGANIKGYIHWSLLDNFEWQHGWWPKFGLLEVDRAKGMKRTPRKSTLWWASELKKLTGVDKAR